MREIRNEDRMIDRMFRSMASWLYTTTPPPPRGYDFIAARRHKFSATEVTFFQIFVTSVAEYEPYLELWSRQIMFSTKNT